MTEMEGIFRFPMAVLVFTLATMAGFGSPAFAQTDEDLSDNDVCLQCHAGTQWSAPEDSDRPRVHQDSGAFIQDAHDMWSCNDCHTDILEIPHREDIERDVQCTNCHATTPE